MLLKYRVKQNLKLGDKMKTHCKNPGRIDELRKGCKREDIKLGHLQGRSKRTW